MVTVMEWQIETAAAHTVSVEHNTLSGRVVVRFDGVEVFRRPRKFWDTGCEHRFVADGKRCVLRVLYRTWHYEYELWVDGRLQ